MKITELAKKETRFGVPKNCLNFDWAEDINKTCDKLNCKCLLLSDIDCGYKELKK